MGYFENKKRVAGMLIASIIVIIIGFLVGYYATPCDECPVEYKPCPKLDCTCPPLLPCPACAQPRCVCPKEECQPVRCPPC